MTLLEQLMTLSIEKKASDIHVRPNLAPALRINKKLFYLKEFPPVSVEKMEEMAGQMLSPEKKAELEKFLQVDLSYELKGQARFRVNIYHQRDELSIVMRRVSLKIDTLADLNLPPALEKICENRRGLVLLTGTTGSGKSTTLAALVEHINQTRDAHIVTIEDPIEFYFQEKNSLFSQREIGIDTPDYKTALRHVVRQDPDVILIGEMRDLDTMRAALTSAQLGNLVFSTIHTIGAYQTITRIVDLFPPHEQNQIRFMLSDTIQAIISQRLLTRKDAPGMIPAVEIMIATPLVRKYMEENQLVEIHTQMEKGEYYGMQTFNQALLKLLRDGKIDEQIALQASSNPEELLLKMKGISGSTHF